jgi:hypothetical protein
VGCLRRRVSAGSTTSGKRQYYQHYICQYCQHYSCQYCQHYSCQYIRTCSVQDHRSAECTSLRRLALALTISNYLCCVFCRCCVHRCGGDHDNHQATPVTYVKPPVVGGRRVEAGTHVKVSQEQAVEVAFEQAASVSNWKRTI